MRRATFHRYLLKLDLPKPGHGTAPLFLLIIRVKLILFPKRSRRPLKAPGLNKRPEYRMKIDKKLLIPIAMLSIMIAGTVYAFTAVTVTTTLTIGEPLAFVTATGTLTTLSCTGTGLTVSCTGNVSPGQSGTVVITIANSGSASILVTPSFTSSSPDITITDPAPATILAAGTGVFTFNVAVSPSAVPAPATLTFSFAR